MSQRKDKHVRVRLDLIQWVEEQVKLGRFRCFSHAVEYSLIMLRDVEKEE